MVETKPAAIINSTINTITPSPSNASKQSKITMSVDVLDSSSTSTHPLVLRLHETLTTCSQIIAETGDFPQSVLPLVEFLDSVLDAVDSSPDDEISVENSVLILTELYRFISSPSLDEMVLDALSFGLPKVVVKFTGVSDKCQEIVESIIDYIVSTCNPRDMLSVLCEALDCPSKMFKEPTYFAPLLSGLSKVFLRIQRRQFEQIKVAVPVILNVLKSVSAESDDGDNKSVEDLIVRAIRIATSVQEVCQKLEGKRNEELQALLGFFVLEIMVLVSRDLALVLQLSRFLPFCGITYLGLISGCDIDTATRIITGEDGNDDMSCFPHIKLGAAIAVIWAHSSDEVATAGKGDFTILRDILRSSKTKRWQAVGMLKYVFSSIDQPWELKKHAIDFLLSIFDGNISEISGDEGADCSSYTPSLFAALQAIQKVIIYASGPEIRKNAFSAFKRVLADIPSSERFDILKASISNNDSFPSMIAILLSVVKDEVIKENSRRMTQVENNAASSSPFLTSNVLDFVEFVLRPPRGGPPSLPEQGDAVLSALNLYRFLLITESTGKTNYTKVLSKNTLQKVYTEWLLPLRTLVTGMKEENKEDYSRLSVDINCSLNPIELVLYRCIELVEDELKSS